MTPADFPNLQPMETAPRDGTAVWLFRHHRVAGSGLIDRGKLGPAVLMRSATESAEAGFIPADIDHADPEAIHWALEQERQFMGWCRLEDIEALRPQAYSSPEATVVVVPAPEHADMSGAFRAYMVVGRMGLAHTLTYLFLSGSPTLPRVEAMVRCQPHAFPGNVVVIDLGETYGSRAEADSREADMRANLSRACSFYIGALEPASADAGVDEG